MDVPKPNEQHARLESFAGWWTAEERWLPSPTHPEGKVTTGRMQSRMALNGFAVLQDYQHEEKGVVTFRGHGIFRWDRTAQEYSLFQVDSSGGPSQEYRGQCENGVFTLYGNGPTGAARTVLETQDGSYTVRYDVAADGDTWQTLMEAQYTRG